MATSAFGPTLTRHELSKVAWTIFARLSRAQNRQIQSVAHHLYGTKGTPK